MRGDLLIGQVGPADSLPHRVARRAIPEHPQEVLLQVRDGFHAPLRPAPFLRTLPSSPSGYRSMSRWPWRIVLGSQPRSVEIYPVPPWPSLAASMAAYRLRSFSESESWNIRIARSISGLYVMGGRPLRGLDRPGYRYTIRTGNREVIESAILNWVLNGISEVLARLDKTQPNTDAFCVAPRGNHFKD